MAERVLLCGDEMEVGTMGRELLDALSSFVASINNSRESYLSLNPMIASLF